MPDPSTLFPIPVEPLHILLLPSPSPHPPGVQLQSLDHVVAMFDADDPLLAECAAKVLARAGRAMMEHSSSSSKGGGDADGAQQQGKQQQQGKAKAASVVPQAVGRQLHAAWRGGAACCGCRQIPMF